MVGSEPILARLGLWSDEACSEGGPVTLASASTQGQKTVQDLVVEPIFN